MTDVLREYIRESLLLERDNSCRYEASVIRTLKISGIAGRIKRAACSDAMRPDADMKIDGEVHFVEVKANGRAQMGGGSVGYDTATKSFYAVGLNRELSETIADLLNSVNDTSLHKGLKTLLQHLSRSSGKQLTIVPVSGFSAQSWEDARDFGLLRAINRTFESSTEVIAQHYARKDTYYIQIGGAGFFRLGEANPANLPVPILQGRVQLEVRLAKSGDMGNVSKAGMRVQARLLAGSKSPYTLDDLESIKAMLAAKNAPRKARTKTT